VWAAALVGCSLWLLGLECVDWVWGIWGGVGALGRRAEGWWAARWRSREVICVEGARLEVREIEDG